MRRNPDIKILREPDDIAGFAANNWLYWLGSGRP